MSVIFNNTDIPELDDFAESKCLPFIQREMEKLAEYDNRRPPNHPYEFHLHSQRVAQDMKNFCLYLGGTPAQARTLYWATLIHDIGKRVMPIELWDTADGEKPTAAMKETRRQHTILGVMQVLEKAFPDKMDHPFLALTRAIMIDHHVANDGTGFPKDKTWKHLSLPVKMVILCDSFDGWQVWRPHFQDRDVSTCGVLKRMNTEKNSNFEEDLLAAYTAYKKQQEKAQNAAIQSA